MDDNHLGLIIKKELFSIGDIVVIKDEDIPKKIIDSKKDLVFNRIESTIEAHNFYLLENNTEYIDEVNLLAWSNKMTYLK